MSDKQQADTPRIFRFGKVIIFCLLLFVEIMILITNWASRVTKWGIYSWYVALPVIAVLTAENVLKMWVAKSFTAKIPCYVVDSVLLIVLTVFTDGQLTSTLYIVVLSEFYLNAKNMAVNIAMGVVSAVLFIAAFAVTNAMRGEAVDIGNIISKGVNDLILMAFHFLIFNFTVQIYLKNREVTKALDEASESNAKLKEAYNELQEITALEERQRIAKDIHDTAGHSITTVIMQTEAARVMFESDPKEAKRRITAANLQAKNALEELRESVHLLSGTLEAGSVKEMLLGVIHDSTDGTDITVRYEIEDVSLCEAKRRFFTNALKEGISNGLRHGGATAFWFELRQQGRKVNFLLSDNGSGFDKKNFREGFGLAGMRKRAEMMGGKVKFDGDEEEGFEVHITLPADVIER